MYKGRSTKRSLDTAYGSFPCCFAPVEQIYNLTNIDTQNTKLKSDVVVLSEVKNPSSILAFTLSTKLFTVHYNLLQNHQNNYPMDHY